MPNWCENMLTISGTTKQIQEIYEKYFTDGKIDFNKIIPQPTREEAEKNYKDYIIHNAEEAQKHHLMYEGDKDWFNWYNWNVRYWGTKWNADTWNDAELTDTGDGNAILSTLYGTAWSPAIPILYKLQKLYPDVNINCTYFEGGCAYAGYFEDGVEYEIEDKDLPNFALEHGFISEEEYNEYYITKDNAEEE